ncbi:MAG TPA: SEC-C domain-containing protein [Bacillales bacterium]|nr:SEC-C domain-containing protein [Bacillales bacterium]
MKTYRKDQPCPCGSGKIYQDCCMERDNKVVDFQQKVIDREIRQFQEVFFDFTDIYREQMAEYLGACGQKYRLTDGPHFTEEYIPLFMIWAALNAPVVEGKSPFRRFTKDFGDRFHPVTYDLMKKWDTVPEFYEAVSELDGDMITVRSLETGKDYSVNLNNVSPFQIKNTGPYEGSGLIGALVPAGDSHIFLLGHKQFDLELLKSLNETLPAGENRKEYIRSTFPLILEQAFSSPPDLGTLVEPHTWKTDKQRAAAELFCLANRNKEKMGILNIGVLMWNQHCLIKNPRIHKEAIYAAALERITDKAINFDGLSDTELANKYGVTRDSVVQRVEDMEYLLFDLLMDDGIEMRPM